jgi:hypothetical protein
LPKKLRSLGAGGRVARLPSLRRKAWPWAIRNPEVFTNLAVAEDQLLAPEETV